MVIQGMGYEVDYLPVGEGEKSGDAIAMRWGDLEGRRADQCVIVIDGGTKESGLALVEHIRRYYRTNWVNLVVCTHCDADHASGLSVVLEQVRVGALLMHEPWEHAEEIHSLVKDRRTTRRSLARKMEAGLGAAHELWEVAERRGVCVVELFSGLKATLLGQTVRVLGPSEEYYKEQLSMFRSVPATMTQQKSSQDLQDIGKDILAQLIPPNQSRCDPIEIAGVQRGRQTPDFSPTTSAENNSSAVIFLRMLGHKMMFTGDAGVEALTRAIEHGEQRCLDFSDLDFFHVPHHGSEYNIDSSVLGRIRTRTAFVSAAPDGAPKHPSSEVTNSLIDQGTKVYATQGRVLRCSVNAPRRPGWSPATPVPYDESLNPDDFRFRLEALPVRVNPASIEISYSSHPRFPRSSR